MTNKKEILKKAGEVLEILFYTIFVGCFAAMFIVLIWLLIGKTTGQI